MTSRDQLEAVIRRELTTTVAAAYGSPAFMTARYNAAAKAILHAVDAYATRREVKAALEAREEALDDMREVPS